MSAPIRRQFRRNEFHAQAAEAIGIEPGIDLVLDDGSTVEIPHPLYLDDDHQAAVEAARADDSAGSIEMARVIVGDENHKRLLESGYSSNDVMMAWMMLSQSITGTVGKLPDGRPTRSATSLETVPST